MRRTYVMQEMSAMTELGLKQTDIAKYLTDKHSGAKNFKSWPSVPVPSVLDQTEGVRNGRHLQAFGVRVRRHREPHEPQHAQQARMENQLTALACHFRRR